MKQDDIRSGVKVDKLTAIRPWGRSKRGINRWLFKCDCGNYQPARVSSVGVYTKSCGHCGTIPADREDCRKNGIYHQLYQVRWGFIRRCTKENDKKYKDYGGRGIKICDEWNDSYSTFKKWALDNGWKPNLTWTEQSLDRIDVNGNYEPDNCRWVNAKTQARNKRNNIWIVYNNKRQLLIDVVQQLNLSYDTVRQRYCAGKRGEDLFFPKEKIYRYSVCGEMMTIDEICIKYNTTRSAVKNRIHRKTLDKLEVIQQERSEG